MTGADSDRPLAFATARALNWTAVAKHRHEGTAMDWLTHGLSAIFGAIMLAGSQAAANLYAAWKGQARADRADAIGEWVALCKDLRGRVSELEAAHGECEARADRLELELARVLQELAAVRSQMK